VTRLVSALMSISLGIFAGSALALPQDGGSAPPTPPGALDDPNQPTVVRDVQRSHPFSVRVENLMAGGMSAEEARAQALQELGTPGGPDCLVYEIEVLYCTGNGSIARLRKLISSKCLDDMWGRPGCTPLTCPPGWSPPQPCQLSPCQNGWQRPMWDTAIDASCFGLPSSVTCAWIYPTTTVPFWGPCDGLVDCSCLPELANCTTLTVECRNPSRPAQVGDPCPNCN